MARDIEEFLRKAAERRAAQQKGQQPGATPPAAQPAPPPPPRQAPGGGQRGPDLTRPVVQPRTIDAGGSDMREEPDPFPSGQSVAEHVQKHIDSGASEIAQQTKRLGERVGQAGKKVKARVQQKFDHEVGNLAESQGRGELKPVPPPEAKARAAAASIAPQTIVELLRSPQALRTSIIVNELLKRPEWD